MSETESNTLVYAYAKEIFNDLLDPENEGKCVLFVDELNRQKSPQLRRPFMSLFNEKRNASGSLDFRKNLLFSVVCINPYGVNFHDKGVDELTPAERNRFAFKRTGKHSMDSTPENSLSYFKG
jgi:MoxR-like ATPase